MKPRDAWLATQGQLELQLNRATYDTWLRDCKFLSYDEGVFTLSVRNAYAKDWLEQRLYRSVRHTLSVIFQRPVEINFVVSSPIQPRNSFDTDFQIQTAPEPIENPYPYPAYSEPDPYPYANVVEEVAVTQEDTWATNLSAAYTFDNFVVGPSNQMAHAAAQAIARSPGQIYNPLFFYGDVGLGKTHLMQAVGNACIQKGLKVLYTTSEQFTNLMIESIRHKTTADFRDHFRLVDVLVVDDVQFIAGKDSTQEEFFHTFNALHNLGKQVILAADRRPSQIKGLEKRLVSRLEWGLTVEILPPSLETRLAIVRDKSEVQGYRLPYEVAQIIAEYSQGNVRELEGTLTQILAHTALMGIPLTLDTAERILTDQRVPSRRRDQAATKRRLSLEQIIEGTAKALQLSLRDLVGKNRSREIAQARQWAIYLAREETHASWPEIGEALGGRNHSTVLYSYNKIVEQLASDPAVRQKMDVIRQRIHEIIN